VVYQAEATKPADVLKLVEEATDGQLADVVINNVNVEDTEMATILAAKDDGIIYFFSMATSFTKAALGAEGIGKDATMLIGNGYARDHAAISLQVIRDNPKLRELFTRLYT
jgi:L-erythro-3,5-diaminohexanoate dehydrogenase